MVLCNFIIYKSKIQENKIHQQPDRASENRAIMNTTCTAGCKSPGGFKRLPGDAARRISVGSRAFACKGTDKDADWQLGHINTGRMHRLHSADLPEDQLRSTQTAEMKHAQSEEISTETAHLQF